MFHYLIISTTNYQIISLFISGRQLKRGRENRLDANDSWLSIFLKLGLKRMLYEMTKADLKVIVINCQI
jgi:hypothetical protein